MFVEFEKEEMLNDEDLYIEVFSRKSEAMASCTDSCCC